MRAPMSIALTALVAALVFPAAGLLPRAQSRVAADSDDGKRTVATASGTVPAGMQAEASRPAAAGGSGPIATAILRVEPSTAEAAVGDTVDVTVTLEVSGDCTYHPFELTLRQSGDSIFDHVVPPSPTVGPGVALPLVYTVEAVATGTTKFDAQLYGEWFCGFFNWAYVNGGSVAVRVTAGQHVAILPAMSRE